MEEQLLKSDDVARILQVSRAYAYLLMRRGDIPIVRVGNTVRVLPGDLEHYIQEMHSTSTDKPTEYLPHPEA